MAKHPTKKGRKRWQRKKKQASQTLEMMRLKGQTPMVPEEALKERVDPSSQDEQRFPGLDRLAIRQDGRGWSVPEHVKRKVIEVNAEVVFEEERTVVIEGTPIKVGPDRKAQHLASKVLIEAAKHQHEIDNPEAAGKAKGGVKVEQNVAVINPSQEYLRRIKEVEVDEIEEKLKEVEDVSVVRREDTTDQH